MDYATEQARIQSFAPPTKRSKAGWPHKKPTPSALAKSGFYWNPSTSHRDNVSCFHCATQLDGWGPNDDPNEEHLRHGHDCAWATLMALNSTANFDVSDMEDPTGDRLTKARQSTFDHLGWPHDGKKGWICKTDRMVEAGWYFTPTTECEDYVSCVYCNLCLDGWEPKDDPFEEHYKRSRKCPFFSFAGTVAPSTRPKAKKGRTTRTSRTSKLSTRLSAQSNNTLLSQDESCVDVDDTMEASLLSIQSTASTATATKRKAPAKSKVTRTKKARTTKVKQREPSPEVEAEIDDGPNWEAVEMAEAPDSDRQARQETQHDTNTRTHDQTTTPPVEPSYPEPAQVREKLGLQRQNTTESHRPSRTRRSETSSQQVFATPLSEAEPVQVNTPAESETETTPQAPTQALGPPARQSSPITVKQQSPLKAQTNPPLPVISSAPSQSSTRRKSSRLSRPEERRPCSESDSENIPPTIEPERAKSPTAHPTKSQLEQPQLVWTPADLDTIFQGTPAAQLFQQEKGAVTEQEKAMTLQEWIEHAAEQAAENLNKESERIVSIFEREGRRAMAVLEGIAVAVTAS